MSNVRIVIVEQPQQRGMRFRYECEGRSAGSIPGESTTTERKTWPTCQVLPLTWHVVFKLFTNQCSNNWNKNEWLEENVCLLNLCNDDCTPCPSVKKYPTHDKTEAKQFCYEIENFSGVVIIRVSLVSKDDPPRPHPHSLVGRDCRNGICQITIDPATQMQAVFPNLGIQCVRRKEVNKAISDRLRQGVNPFNAPIDGDDRSAADIDLTIVRLCFEAFLPDQRSNYTRKLPPVVSNPIYDKKAPSSSLLKICRVDKTHGSVLGKEEVFLLCDKVQKEDIEVVFSHNGWEATGDFSTTDVHRQVAIVFKTPAYRDERIKEEIEVQMRLRRPSDKETSAPVPFIYVPVHYPFSRSSFPLSMTSTFSPSGAKKRRIREAIEERKMTSVSRQTKPQSRPDPRRPQASSRFPRPLRAASPMQPHSSFISLSSRKDMSSHSGFNRPLKQEMPFGQIASDFPYPNVPPQQSLPQFDPLPPKQYEDPSSHLLQEIPPEESVRSLTEMFKECDSFPSIGPEATSEVLKHTTAVTNHYDVMCAPSPQNHRELQGFDNFVQRSRNTTKDSCSSQPLTYPHDSSLMGPNEIDLSQGANFIPAPSPHPSTMLSPVQAMSPSMHFPQSANIVSPQQYPPTPMSFHDLSSAMSPLQEDSTFTPMMPTTESNLAAQQNFQYQTPHPNFTFMANNNNNNQQFSAPSTDDNRETSFERLLNDLQ